MTHSYTTLRIKNVFQYLRVRHATIVAVGIVTVAVFLLFFLLFTITRGENPHMSELAFVEHSSGNLGSVVPASCESNPITYNNDGVSYSGCQPFTCWDSSIISVPAFPNPFPSNPLSGACPNLPPPPTIDSVTISSPTVAVDGVTQYTITEKASDSTGVSAITSEMVTINQQGPHAGEYRGRLGWYNGDATTHYWLGGNAKTPAINCAGGGSAAISNAAGSGALRINLHSCNTSISGNTRTVEYVVSFNSNYNTPRTNNTLSGYANGNNSQVTGWIPSGTFTLLSNVGVSIGTTTKIITASITSVTNATPFAPYDPPLVTQTGPFAWKIGSSMTRFGTSDPAFPGIDAKINYTSGPQTTACYDTPAKGLYRGPGTGEILVSGLPVGVPRTITLACTDGAFWSPLITLTITAEYQLIFFYYGRTDCSPYFSEDSGTWEVSCPE